MEVAASLACFYFSEAFIRQLVCWIGSVFTKESFFGLKLPEVSCEKYRFPVFFVGPESW